MKKKVHRAGTMFGNTLLHISTVTHTNTAEMILKEGHRAKLEVYVEIKWLWCSLFASSKLSNFVIVTQKSFRHEPTSVEAQF